MQMRCQQHTSSMKYLKILCMKYRHKLSSLYVLLSRAQYSKQLRILEGQPGSVAGLAGSAMRQREELVVFEQSYGADRRYSRELALDAYDAMARA